MTDERDLTTAEALENARRAMLDLAKVLGETMEEAADRVRKVLNEFGTKFKDGQ